MLTPGIALTLRCRTPSYEPHSNQSNTDPNPNHAPPENSPNRALEVWGAPVIEFHTYVTRREELDALAKAVRHNLGYDGLTPSLDILVMISSSGCEAARLRAEVVEHLIGCGVRIFTPGALECNVIRPKYRTSTPIISGATAGLPSRRFTEPKGNEAEMGHVAGLDLMARDGRAMRRASTFATGSSSHCRGRAAGLG